MRLGSADSPMSPRNTTYPTRVFLVAIMAADVNGLPTVFRTYSSRGNLRASKCTVWEATRATSATPSLFKEMLIETPVPGISYIDGGFGGFNNPSQLALQEAEGIWPDEKGFCLVSLGTGRQAAAGLVSTAKAKDDTEARSVANQEIFPPGQFAVASHASAWGLGSIRRYGEFNVCCSVEFGKHTSGLDAQNPVTKCFKSIGPLFSI
jgi:hypothetical protein